MDLTLAFFAHGKTTIFEKGASADNARSLLKSTGKTLPVTQAILDVMTMFTTQLMYNDMISKSLGEARARKRNQMK